MVSIKIPFLDLAKVADSGQAFRIKVIDDSHIELVAYGRYLQVAKTGKDTLALSCTEDEFNTIWKTYFDLDRDYQKIVKSIDKYDGYLLKASEFGKGIRILTGYLRDDHQLHHFPETLHPVDHDIRRAHIKALRQEDQCSQA